MSHGDTPIHTPTKALSHSSHCCSWYSAATAIAPTTTADIQAFHAAALTAGSLPVLGTNYRTQGETNSQIARSRLAQSSQWLFVSPLGEVFTLDMTNYY
jgi:hypothetical protein